jgi:hypothetical protein
VIGVLQLDTQFPRPIGDAGHPASWGEPIQIKRVPRATVSAAVRATALEASLIENFITQRDALVSAGARCIVTSCGFLAAVQGKLQDGCAVPVLASSLCALPILLASGHALEEIGVLSFDASQLNAAHFAGCAAPMPAAIGGLLQHGVLAQTILNDGRELDLRAACTEVVSAARALKTAFPPLRTLLLECTNLGPYRAAMTSATGCAVLDLVDTVALRCPLR